MVGRLLAGGHEVVAIVGRQSSECPVLDAARAPRLTVLTADLAEGIPLDRAVEVIVHAAAVSPGPGVEATAADFIRNNAEATRRLVQWGQDRGVHKVVYCSSVSVYGRISGPVVDESSPRVDPDAYGVSKWLGEAVLSEQKGPMASLSLRLPGVIGPGAVRNWLSTMAKAAQQGQEIQYFHGDADFNNAVHIDDLGRFVSNLLTRTWKGHDVVTLGADGVMKVRDMVRAIVAGLGGRSSMRELPAPRPAFTISSARAQRVYGYQPMAMPDIVSRFVAECRA